MRIISVENKYWIFSVCEFIFPFVYPSYSYNNYEWEIYFVLISDPTFLMTSHWKRILSVGIGEFQYTSPQKAIET